MSKELFCKEEFVSLRYPRVPMGFQKKNSREIKKSYFEKKI